MPGLWYAGFAFYTGMTPPFVLAPITDPINLVVYKPSGGAREAFQNGLNAAGGWFNNTCYDHEVAFYPGHDSNPNNWRFSSPDGSYATDVSTANDPPFFSGCGTTAHERDHLRYWSSADDTIVWVAASYEYRCSPVHCLSSDGFNRGRSTLNASLYSGLVALYPSVSDDAVLAYLGDILQGVHYDGYVDVLTV